MNGLPGGPPNYSHSLGHRQRLCGVCLCGVRVAEFEFGGVCHRARDDPAVASACELINQWQELLQVPTQELSVAEERRGHLARRGQRGPVPVVSEWTIERSERSRGISLATGVRKDPRLQPAHGVAVARGLDHRDVCQCIVDGAVLGVDHRQQRRTRRWRCEPPDTPEGLAELVGELRCAVQITVQQRE